jgi:mannitol-specific phosphotransferase system IIBC component
VKAIDDGLKKKEEVIRKAQHEEIEKQARGQIVSQTQIEAVLSSIAMGTFKRKKMIAAIDVKSKKVITGEIEEVPTETDMISAADKLLKVKGAYAKDNVVKHEVGDTFLELMKARAKRKKENVQPGDH